MDNKANFLSNKPSGLDLFDGQSQEKVAEAIKKHIESTKVADMYPLMRIASSAPT